MNGRTPRSSRESKREQLKDRILQGAIRAMVDVGPAAGTTRKIAEAADVNLATLHYYFANKDALLIGTLETMVHEASTVLREGLDTRSTLDKTIDSLLTNAWTLICSGLENQILQYELTLYVLRSKEEAAVAKWQYDEYCRIYSSLFAEAGEREGVPAIDYRAIARFVVAGIDGLILQHLSDPDEKRSWAGVQLLAEATKALLASRRAGLER
jgi:AcrR family transcriptional regulator